MEIRSNKEAIKIVFDLIWNQKKLDLIDSVFNNDCEIFYSKEDIIYDTYKFKQRLINWFDLVDKSRYEIKDYIEKDGKIVVRWVGSGVYTGLLSGVKGKNKHFSFEGVSIFFMGDDFKIKQAWVFNNLHESLSL